MKGIQGKTETVKVAIRVRPMNSLEKKNNSTLCVEVDKNNNQVAVTKAETGEDKTFQYDYVYAAGTSQRQIYDEIAFPLVESVFEGYNGTIFAYGQTGCGKTFTMMGDYNNPELRGVIPNTFSHIFGYISNEGGSKKFLVRCSFLEIYNEEIRDLLSQDSTKKMEVREDPKVGIFVKDLKILQVKNTQEIENCLTLGNKNKHVGETTMNQESSRSHCIFTVYVEIGENLDDTKNKKIKAGKLNLVDLAGSERQSKTGATGNRLDEAKKINLSLTALSNVINALVENKQHVPYRDSKLTRLLQDSLGGNTKTVMIAAISPSSFNHDETLGTLRYAARANAIKNAPKVNEDPKDTLLRQYEEQIKKLKEQIESGGPVVLNSSSSRNLIKPEEGDDDYKHQLNEERNRYENYLKEKDQLLAHTNLEKEKLAQKIQDLEKEMNKKLINGGDEKDEKEKKKFKEYREKQMKMKDEVKKRNELLEEKKKEQEEALQNDVIKLRNKIKYLESEITDLRYENEKDREDIVDTVRELNKESKLYHNMLKMILSENEIKRITEMSKWSEDNEEWKIHPFCFKEKKLNLPTIKPHQVTEFVENEINSRELVLENSRSNKLPSNNKDMMRESKQNFIKQNKNIRYDETTPDLFTIKNPVKTNTNNATGGNNTYPSKLIQLESLKKQQYNQNLFVINRKEAKKYEDLLKNSHNFNQEMTSVLMSNNNTGSNINSVTQNQSGNKIKSCKVILDPINSNPFNQSKKNFHQNSNNNKKMEVSFKATLQFTDDNGMNNKIEISPNINVHNPGIINVNMQNHNNINNKKIKLGKIQDEVEFDD